MRFQDMPYERIDFAKVQEEMGELIRELEAAKSGEEQFEVHQKYYALTDRVMTLMTIANIRFDIDTSDKFYEEEHKYYDEQGPVFSNLVLAYQKKLYESPYRAYLEEKIGPVAFKNMELAQKSMSEALIPLMQEENSLTMEYDKLIAGAKIDFDGRELNLSLLRPYLVNSDRNVRRQAWEKMSAFFLENEEKLDSIYDKLVKNRTAQARAMGYENYLELGYYRMNRNCYGKNEVEAFRKQIKEYFVPFAEKLHDRRRQRLGLEKLSYIDEQVYFKDGNPAPTGTPEEIMAAGQKMYRELSPETAEFFDFMMENQLFDVLGRKTKKAGGYMTYLPLYHAPFIFANFNGTSGDVDVITHECGHAFQGYLAAQDPIREHADIGMETAEIHSMSMEFFTEKWMNLFFGDRAQDYVEMHLEDAAAFIPYGCMVDEFQHIVYEHPELTPAERKQAWSRLEREYKPHLDYEGDPFFGQGGFWQKQLHIYDYPLYYIDYCLAQTCALQYKVKMDADFTEAWKSYLKLCRLSASDFYTNMIKEVVFVAYLLISSDAVTLYINNVKLTPEVSAYLEKEHITVDDYENVRQGLRDYFEYNIQLDPNEINYTLFHTPTREVVRAQSPIPEMKSHKNETEIRGFRNAMLRDGIAMVKFLKWLKPAVEAGGQTEISLDQKLTGLRAEQPLFRDISFDTIVGYQEHSAVVHYEASPETDIPVRPEGLILIDSGAQYQDGTTDLTRTIALGPITEEMRHIYTLVLKSHIQFELVKFPDGACGTQLDAAGRECLWREGLNFLHGTGHGVGAYLNVHEGPHQIRMEYYPTPLRSGMTVTDEPGIYLAGKFGVRIENVLLIRPYLETEFGKFLQMTPLTLSS